LTEPYSRLLTLAICCNFVVLAVFGADWSGLVPVSASFSTFALGLLFAASLVLVFLRFRARVVESDLERLKVSESRLGALFEHSPICMDLKDIDGRYLLVNAAYCDWLNKSTDEILGRSNAEVYASDPVRRAKVDKIERTVADTGQLLRQQVKVRRGDKVHERLLVKFPLRGEQGDVVAVGTCAVDLTVQKETEDALARERERASHLEGVLREAIMAMPAAFAIFDSEDRLVICNAEFAQYYPSFQNDPELGEGRAFQGLVDELIAAGHIPATTPEDTAEFAALRMKQHREAAGTPFETRVKDRVLVNTETRMPQGGTIILRQDITEQRQLEKERQETEDLLRSLFEHLDQGVTIRDLGCRVVRLNKAASEWSGLPAAEIIGKTTEDLLRLTGHQQEAEGIIDEERALMVERRRDVSIRKRVNPDGSTRHIRLSRFPIIGSAGGVQGLGALGYDVTELIETQEALQAAKEHLEATVLERTGELRASEKRFRNLAQASADWFWECDTDYRFTHLSESFPVPDGLSGNDLIGMALSDYFAAGDFDSDVCQKLIDALLKREPLRDFEITRPVGSEIQMYRITAMPVYEDGVFTGYTGSTADIAELYQARQSLVEAERMASLGALVAGVAHEINTPIGVCVTAISTVSEDAGKLYSRLREGSLKRSDLESGISNIAEGAVLVESNLERAARLVSSFKSVAVDRTSEAERDFNLIGYTREVIESLSPQLGRDNIAVRVYGDEDIELKSYPGALAQILTNLAMNSIIHGFEDSASGNIEIEISREGASAKLTYRDDGCGMSAETVRRVFDPFFTTRLGHGGSGLGMHIVFNLVSQVLLGAVQCRSEPEKGVEFEIQFPIRSPG
jgi:PAS domain S-box-containing protein